MNKIQIASFNTPSGVSLLANILLELGYYNYIMLKGDWIDRKTNKILINSQQYKAYQGYMPFVLKLKDKFTPKSNIEFFWGHQWPTLEFQKYQTIILYRDVIDSIISQYRREYPSENINISHLKNFMNTENIYIGLSIQDEWALFYLLWMNLTNGKIISFNGLKNNGIEEIEKLLANLIV